MGPLVLRVVDPGHPIHIYSRQTQVKRQSWSWHPSRTLQYRYLSVATHRQSPTVADPWPPSRLHHRCGNHILWLRPSLSIMRRLSEARVLAPCAAAWPACCPAAALRAAHCSQPPLMAAQPHSHRCLIPLLLPRQPAYHVHWEISAPTCIASNETRMHCCSLGQGCSQHAGDLQVTIHKIIP